MKRHRPILDCKCKYCGFEWQFEAKSKADAARMTGDAVCSRPDCSDKLAEEIKINILFYIERIQTLIH
jgi:hypothetical protein